MVPSERDLARERERVPSVSHIIRLLSAAAKTQINLWVKGRIL